MFLALAEIGRRLSRYPFLVALPCWVEAVIRATSTAAKRQPLRQRGQAGMMERIERAQGRMGVQIPSNPSRHAGCSERHNKKIAELNKNPVLIFRSFETHFTKSCRAFVYLQSILPAHCGCPHPQEISTPVFTVSQWGLQYLLSFAAKQLQPGCAHWFLSLSAIDAPPNS
jgi:hypothetical protein